MCFTKKKDIQQTTLDSFFDKEIKNEITFYKSYRDYIPLGSKWADIQD